jgi:glucose dehydrogenase
MLGTLQARKGGIVILLVGLAFFVMGLSRRQNGGSAAFMVIGLAFVSVGIRRMRRATSDSAV